MGEQNGEADQKYIDIIDLPHKDPTARHPRMTMLNRAAQFAPFAALKGYEEAIGETARYTDERPELSDDAKELLDRKIGILAVKIDGRPMITATYFRPDERKKGGACVTVTDRAERVDRRRRIIQLQSRGKIPVEELLELTGEVFDDADADGNG